MLNFSINFIWIQCVVFRNKAYFVQVRQPISPRDNLGHLQCGISERVDGAKPQKVKIKFCFVLIKKKVQSARRIFCSTDRDFSATTVKQPRSMYFQSQKQDSNFNLLGAWMIFCVIRWYKQKLFFVFKTD